MTRVRHHFFVFLHESLEHTSQLALSKTDHYDPKTIH